MVVTLGFDVLEGDNVDIVADPVIPLGLSVEIDPVGPVTMVRVTTVTPGIFVAEFGSVVTIERPGAEVLGPAGIVTTLPPP